MEWTPPQDTALVKLLEQATRLCTKAIRIKAQEQTISTMRQIRTAMHVARKNRGK